MQNEQEVHAELAIHDLQRRLAILGYRLGDEAEKGLFGEKTAAAVTTFKVSTGLGNDDTIDQATWTALKDASMQLGDRPLYLHIPHFRGRDVGELQGALSSMGFACAVDNSFGPETEQVLREFQNDMALSATGILDAETLMTMLRLRHVWEGKRGFFLEGRIPELARSAEVLASWKVCVFGIDEPTRVIANRVANLARATTVDSGVLSVSALETAPKKDMLLVGLKLQNDASTKKEQKAKKKEGRSKPRQVPASSNAETPCVYLSSQEKLITELAEAIKTVRGKGNRLTLVIDTRTKENEDLSLQRQEIAAQVLDTLCLALQKT